MRDALDPWRAVFMENGQRRYREAVTEEKLAAKLEKVTERLQADAPNLQMIMKTLGHPEELARTA